jgi:TrmH family RNA methyltransferase
MGSAFRVPIWTEVSYADVIAQCRERGVRTIGAAAKASTTYTEVNWRGSCALIVGPESTGLSSDELAVVDEAVRIPMKGSAESLNVAVATGILLYEANRQREGSR